MNATVDTLDVLMIPEDGDAAIKALMRTQEKTARGLQVTLHPTSSVGSVVATKVQRTSNVVGHASHR